VAAGQSQSDTSNTSMDSTDTATMHNREGVHPAGTHSNPIPSSVLSKPTWPVTPPPAPPQSGEPAHVTKQETTFLTNYCNVLSFAPVQSWLQHPHNERTLHTRKSLAWRYHRRQCMAAAQSWQHTLQVISGL